MSDTFDFSQAKRGPIIDPKGKTRITIMLDDDVLQAFRERAANEGKGYQTLINESLRNALKAGPEPDIALALKQISESLAVEKVLRERENAVFINTIADASEAFDKALHTVEHAGKRSDFSRQELDNLRRAASAVDMVKEFIKAARPVKLVKELAGQLRTSANVAESDSMGERSSRKRPAH
ncbi:MAG TPA: BrnA antitoxin family protein [Paraburkholderia sp.]|jgi:predicted DNA binding CopG/RHH family protein|uniref:BrnA antitoxin family protein n=1 Tax=Paraburkholderia sp. TaxID=1926495 RepID=UPI002DEC7969|nr:BrnA antitoxin family protein [Paraburkholderia sp.]